MHAQKYVLIFKIRIVNKYYIANLEGIVKPNAIPSLSNYKAFFNSPTLSVSILS